MGNEEKEAVVAAPGQDSIAEEPEAEAAAEAAANEGPAPTEVAAEA